MIDLDTYRSYNVQMNIKSYIKSYPCHMRGEVRQVIARAAGVSPGAVRHWENGIRNVPAKRAPMIEAATNGQVTIMELLFPRGVSIFKCDENNC
ncbi:MAG: helix-turn-helix domain-containing protein [Magnetococcales bacterium]|nr:helix-turn-helix domain-containing protein [Magnetococcales bacterium]